MAKKSIKIKNKRFTIHEVPQPSEAVEHLVEKGYRRPFKDSIGLVDFFQKKIIIAEKLKPTEKESTIFHELIHIALPKMAERDVLELEKHLYPVLKEYGLKFRQRKIDNA